MAIFLTKTIDPLYNSEKLTLEPQIGVSSDTELFNFPIIYRGPKYFFPPDKLHWIFSKPVADKDKNVCTKTDIFLEISESRYPSVWFTN